MDYYENELTQSVETQRMSDKKYYAIAFLYGCNDDCRISVQSVVLLVVNGFPTWLKGWFNGLNGYKCAWIRLTDIFGVDEENPQI